MEHNEPPTTAHRAVLGDRSLFPALGDTVYLNHAAISPPSLAVKEQVDLWMAEHAADAIAGKSRWVTQQHRLKEKLASFIGASADELAFVPNTTTGIADIALCMPWREGDVIVAFEGEFPANVTPWQRAAASFGAEVVLLPIEPFMRGVEEGLASLKTILETRPVRLVTTSLVRFQTGLRMPVERMGQLAHQHGAELFVDGIQGVGVVPFELEHIDYLACGSHKWLMGLMGGGFLYVSAQCMKGLVPRIAGWMSHEEAFRFLFEGEGHLRHDRALRQDPSIFELGAMSDIGCAALEASLDLIAQLGVESIFEHVQRIHDALEPLLVARGLHSERAADPALRSGSLCVRVPTPVGRCADSIALAASLRERGVAVTTPDGRVRFAPHWPNDITQCERIDAALAGC